MGVISRGRRIRFDNIAVGSVTGTELTNAEAVTRREIYGGGYQTSTSTGDTWHSNIAVGSSVSDQVSPDTVPENLIDLAVVAPVSEAPHS